MFTYTNDRYEEKALQLINQETRQIWDKSSDSGLHQKASIRHNPNNSQSETIKTSQSSIWY